VRPGIEVLLADSASLVRGRRVGLVTNQSGVDASGVSDVVRLRAAGVRLVALFSPEHGFRGAAGPGAAVASSVDSATGLPIYSLYGRTSAPTDEMLAGIDVLLVDLQDAGARYYTYITTTVDVMKAAAAKGIPVVVLDRPNPIGGAVQGNVLEEAFITPVGRLRMPMRHGLTLGELARLARADLGLATELVVVPVSGWRRASAFDETGLPFIPPSPNLRTLESLFHYPGTCLFEGTNLSVGRGTGAAFEQVGAPWLDTAAVLADLRRAGQGCGRGGSPSRPGRRATGSTPTPCWRASGWRSPTGGGTTRRPPQFTCSPPFGDATPASSAGSRSTSTAWPAPPRSGPRSTRDGTRPRSSGAGSRGGVSSWSGGGRCCCTRSKRALQGPFP
jgi:hypothetical protein